VKRAAKTALLLPCLALTFAGCSDFLQVDPRDRIVLEDFWNEKADVDHVLIACYNRMQNDDVLGRMMVWGEFRSDHIVSGTNIDEQYYVKRILCENIDANNDFTNWVGFYDIINRCNTVMLYAPQVAAKDPAYTDSELKATIAEAKALRDLCYFYLIRTFRDVPYVTEAYIDDNQEIEIPATSFNEVLDALIADLEGCKDDAVLTYPNSQALYQTGRITRQAIYAMLCEMYLWKQDYQNCVKYADLVINAKKQQYNDKYNNATPDADGRLNGYPLELSRMSSSSPYYGNAYNSIFGATNLSAGVGDSPEVIFELVFMNDVNAAPHNGPVNTYYAYGSSNTLKAYVYASSHLATDASSSAGSLYKTTDARYYENINDNGATTYPIAKYTYQSIRIDPTASAIKDKVWMRTAYARNQNFANWIIYRLTDVMLMKAEALAELNDVAGAFDLVQAVNNRSIMESSITSYKLSNPGTQDGIRKMVLEERQRELMFEGKRWYDLVRRSLRDGNTDFLVSKVREKDMENKTYALMNLAKMDAIFWPYNLEELRVNPYLKQNPAFSSGEDTSMKKN
jgi:hypothetical protein